MAWTVVTLSATVDEELEALPADMRARFVRNSNLIAEVGLQHVGALHLKHLIGPLWEMWRMTGKDGISRALYVTVPGKRVVVVRAFIKKTQTTPRREIELALRRAKEVLE